MGFNYASEKKKFENRWKKLKTEYMEAGMSDDAIQQMYEYDLKEFRNKRIISIHEQAFDGLQDSNEDVVLEDRNPLMVKFLDNLITEDKYFANDNRFSWIETIEDDCLYNAVIQLSAIEKELLTKLVIDEFTYKEIAKNEGVTESAIGHRVIKIREKIEPKIKKHKI